MKLNEMENMKSFGTLEPLDICEKMSEAKEDAFWEEAFNEELDTQSFTYNQYLCERQLEKLKREQEELALEVIHMNNNRKYELLSVCIETTLVIVLWGICLALVLSFLDKDIMVHLLYGIVEGVIFALPLTIHCIVCWVIRIRCERDRTDGIEYLKKLQERIENLEYKAVALRERM